MLVLWLLRGEGQIVTALDSRGLASLSVHKTVVDECDFVYFSAVRVEERSEEVATS